MSNLVFMLPFDVRTSEPWADQLTRRLELTPTRVDDWDLQMGFRLVGETGAIRLFKRTTGGGGFCPAYTLLGTAVTPEDRSEVESLYSTCVEGVNSIEARIDTKRLIDPETGGSLAQEGEF